MEKLVGQVIKGYKLTRRIGAGGFGIVYQAEQQLIDREVAIKVILPEYASKPDFIRRFDVEAQIIARLEHPHITPLYDYWREPEGAYLVMRYLRGGSLLDKLNSTGALSPQGASRIVDQIASALNLAHRNDVIHRDIKPANILLDEDGNAYLADFGIAKDLGDLEALETGSNRLVGSLDYISPEQARGEEITPQTDVYALAVLVYEILTGEHPYADVPPVQRLVKHMNVPMPDIKLYDAELNGNINDVLYKATNKSPENRHKTILDFANAYREAIGYSLSYQPSSIKDRLTSRELQILNFIVSGLSDREIAAQLQITTGTIKWNIQQLFQKITVRSRSEAIKKAQELSLPGSSIDDHATDEHSHTSLIALPEPQNPYKGLLAFQTGDAKNFFGREEAIERLIERIREDVRYFRFLAVVGPSGSGKSSLVKAGLIPSLWDGKVTSSENWFVAEMIPGKSPYENLEIALKRIATNLPDDLFETLASSSDGLVTATEQILPQDASELVLFIDQFEELFTLVTDTKERQHFLDMLSHAINSGSSRVRIFITLRADYYDKPLQYAEFGKLLRARMETVLPLDAQELERAIALPAEQVGVAFESGLVAQIVSEMNMQIGALPLLQYALTELFEKRQGRLLTANAYREIGSAVGALARRSDEIYLNMTIQGQLLAQQMFLRLVTLGEGSEDTRRRATREELLSLSDDRDLMEELIDTFASYRLLSLDHDPDTRKPTVEVAHEAILREWQRLRQWLDNNRDDIRQERILARGAEEWDKAGRDPGYLPGGSRLEDIEKWLDNTTLSLTPMERDYVNASIKERDEQLAAERERNERETRLERRSFTILTILVFVFAISTLLAIGLSAFAFTLRNVAEANFARAEQIRLAAQAQIGLDSGGDSVVTALLSLRSLELGYSPEADSTILSALAIGFSEQQFDRHTDAITSLRVSSNNRLLLSGSEDNFARLWNVTTGEEIQNFEHDEGNVVAVSFSPDNRQVVIARADGTIRVRNAVSGREILRIEHDSPISSITLSPDGQHIAASDQTGAIFIWHNESGEAERELIGRTFSVNQIAFSRDGRFIASGGFDTTATVWLVESGERIQEFAGHSRCVCSVEFSHDSRFLLTGGHDNVARLWNINPGDEVQEFIGHQDRITQVAFSPDDELVLTSSLDGTARLWNVETGLEIRRFTGQPEGVSAIAFADDGELIYTGSIEGTIRSWRVHTEPEPLILPNPEPNNLRREIIFSNMLPDARVLVMGNADGTLRYWSVGRSLILREARVGSGAIVNDMALSPGGNTFITAGNGGNLVIYDTTTGSQLQRYVGHRGAIHDVEFSSDGVQAVTGGEDNTVRIWDVFSGQEILQLGGHTAPIRTVAISENKQFVLTGSEDTTVRMWDIEVVRSQHQFRGHENTVRAVAFSPDGLYALSGSDDRTAKLWDTNTGALVHSFEGHIDSVLSVAFSPDGQNILTGSADGTARLWSIESPRVIRNLVEHDHPVNSVSFSADGSQIITNDGQAIFIWRSDLTEVIEVLCAQLPRDFTEQEREFYNIQDNNPTCSDSE